MPAAAWQRLRHRACQLSCLGFLAVGPAGGACAAEPVRFSGEAEPMCGPVDEVYARVALVSAQGARLSILVRDTVPAELEGVMAIEARDDSPVRLHYCPGADTGCVTASGGSVRFRRQGSTLSGMATYSVDGVQQPRIGFIARMLRRRGPLCG